MQADTHEGYRQCMHWVLTEVEGRSAWSGDGLPGNTFTTVKAFSLGRR